MSLNLFRVFWQHIYFFYLFSFSPFWTLAQSPCLASLDCCWVFSGIDKIRLFALFSLGCSDNAIGQVITFTAISLEEENTHDPLRAREMEKPSCSFLGEMCVSNQPESKDIKQSPEKNDLIYCIFLSLCEFPSASTERFGPNERQKTQQTCQSSMQNNKMWNGATWEHMPLPTAVLLRASLWTISYQAWLVKELVSENKSTMSPSPLFSLADLFSMVRLSGSE